MALDIGRRQFVSALGGAALTWPFAARAQQPQMPVIGYVHSGSLDGERRQVDAFHRALSEAGYIEGQNVAIEYRWAEGHFDRVPALLADLVHRRVTVIVAGGGTALAAKAASSSTPVVFTSGVDPVQQGIVSNLSRPDGNMTGVAFFITAMGPKQLELMVQVVPGAMFIGFVTYTAYPYAKFRIGELEAAAHGLGRKLVVQNIASQAEIEPAFAALSQQAVGALIVSADPLFQEWREPLVAAAARHTLPACYALREFTDAGGLMSYGSDLPDAYHQVGVYTARILKGATPADLPVVQAVKVELVINLKTAKSLGLTFPLPLLGRADEVIE
jgi:putative tryptophan/tyrosine transport system substrate-binding protein